MKWLVIVERVEHVSLIIEANDAFSAAQIVEEEGGYDKNVWHKTIDTERIISIIPMPLEQQETE